METFSNVFPVVSRKFQDPFFSGILNGRQKLFLDLGKCSFLSLTQANKIAKLTVIMSLHTLHVMHTYRAKCNTLY